MAAERRKRAAILNSEGDRDSAINSAQGKAQARILEAEAAKKSAIFAAEAQKEAIMLKAEAERQEQILKAQATAQALGIVTEKLNDAKSREALQFLLTQNYLEMGKAIGSSDSSKVMFMDPHSIVSTIEGMRSVMSENRDRQPIKLDLEQERS